LELLCAGGLEQQSTLLSYAAVCFEWLIYIRAQCIYLTFKVLVSTCTKNWTEATEVKCLIKYFKWNIMRCVVE
jgi:hypothetical protein